MSWPSCMEGKIESKYGGDAAQCVSSGSEGNLEGIVECIVNVVEDSQPEVVLADLTAWSVECAL